MSQPSDSAIRCHGADEDEFPDDLEGIDWSVVGPIEGDEPKPEKAAKANFQPSIPEESDPPQPTELPPRPGSSSSSYGFEIETLDEDDLATLDGMERSNGLIAGEIIKNGPSSGACTLDSRKRKLSSRGDLSSSPKKSRTLPLAKPSPKGEEAVRHGDVSLEGFMRAVHHSLLESCTCPICLDLFVVPYTMVPCGHTVCAACLCTWVDQERLDASCPMCRKPLNKTSFFRDYTVEAMMDQQIRILTTPEYQGWGALRPDVLEWNERRTSSFEREVSARLARILAQLDEMPPTLPVTRVNETQLSLPAPPINRPARRRRNRNRGRDQTQAFELTRIGP